MLENEYTQEPEYDQDENTRFGRTPLQGWGPTIIIQSGWPLIMLTLVLMWSVPDQTARSIIAWVILGVFSIAVLLAITVDLILPNIGKAHSGKSRAESLPKTNLKTALQPRPTREQVLAEARAKRGPVTAGPASRTDSTLDRPVMR